MAARASSSTWRCSPTTRSSEGTSFSNAAMPLSRKGGQYFSKTSSASAVDFSLRRRAVLSLQSLVAFSYTGKAMDLGWLAAICELSMLMLNSQRSMSFILVEGLLRCS